MLAMNHKSTPFFNAFTTFYGREKAPVNPNGLNVSPTQAHFMGDGSFASLVKSAFLSVITWGIAPLYYLFTNDFDAQIGEQLKGTLKAAAKGDDEKIQNVDRLTHNELAVIKAVINALHDKTDEILTLFGEPDKLGYDKYDGVYIDCDSEYTLDNCDRLSSIYVTRQGVFLERDLIIPAHQLVSCIQNEVNFSGKKFVAMDFENMNFQNKDMRNMTFDKVHLAGANFTGANLTNTVIKPASFCFYTDKCNIKGEKEFFRASDLLEKKMHDLLFTMESIDDQYMLLKINMMHNLVDDFAREFNAIDNSYPCASSRTPKRQANMLSRKQEVKNRHFTVLVKILAAISQFENKNCDESQILRMTDQVFGLINQFDFVVDSSIQHTLLDLAKPDMSYSEKKMFIQVIVSSSATRLVINNKAELHFLLELIEKRGDEKGSFMSDNASYFLQLLEYAKNSGDPAFKARAERLNLAYERHVLLNVLVVDHPEMLSGLLFEALAQINEKNYVTKKGDYLVELIQSGQTQKSPELQIQVNSLKAAFQEKLADLLLKAIEKIKDKSYVTKRGGYIARLIGLAEKQGGTELLIFSNLLKTA